MNWIQPDGESATKKKKKGVWEGWKAPPLHFSLVRGLPRKNLELIDVFGRTGRRRKTVRRTRSFLKEDPEGWKTLPGCRSDLEAGTQGVPGTGVLQPLSVSPGLLQPHGWSGGDNTCVTSFAGNWLFSCCLLLLCRSYLFRIASSLSLAVVLTTGCKGEAGEMLNIREGCVHGWVLAVSSCRSIAVAGAGILSGRG